jgi:multimeric flavodoxin WrbA
LNEFINGAGDDVDIISHYRFRDMRIGNCKGCYTCRDESRCDQDDDMIGIREAIKDAGLLIFASPIYWCEVTGLMKTFIDRLYFYHHSGNSELIAGKKAIIISPLGESENVEYESEMMIEFYRRVFNSLGIQMADILLFPGLMGVENLKNSPQYKARMFELGQQLRKFI